jgi:hypothetical protein
MLAPEVAPVGFDISNHPVDVALIKQRIVPFIRGGEDRLEDLVARAARLNCIKYRANSWGLGLADYDMALFHRQYELGITRTVRVHKPQGIVDRVLGRPPIFKDTTIPQVTGIPGFDSDLSVWGRPFFIVADTTDEALEGLDTYLTLPDAAPGTVDAVAQRMIAKLDARRDRPPQGFDPSVLQVLFDSYPLAERVTPHQEGEPPDEEETVKRLRRQFDLARTVFTDRDTDAVVEGDDSETVPAAELAPTLAHQVVNLAAQTLPGWMGRGRVWPTALFERIGVRVSGIFERPVSLFEDLLRDVPDINHNLHHTIVENYCLGGYVPPQKMQAFVDLLTKHRRELILAWHQGVEGTADLDRLAADFIKIFEPATYALRRGYGFIEAAEIYSGILGWMN